MYMNGKCLLGKMENLDFVIVCFHCIFVLLFIFHQQGIQIPAHDKDMQCILWCSNNSRNLYKKNEKVILGCWAKEKIIKIYLSIKTNFPFNKLDLSTSATMIIVVEKDASFQRLMTDDFLGKFPNALLVTVSICITWGISSMFLISSLIDEKSSQFLRCSFMCKWLAKLSM